MDPGRWQQIERLYDQAQARPAGERAAFLADACAGDAALRREIELLLAQGASVDGVLDRDAPGAFLSVETPAVLTRRRLGVYHLQEPIGAGGMGEVYRARDTRLGRDVAIKILPAAFTSDPERLARFEREARVLASLNHPHIATIHGVEEGDGVPALVMELVDGETLAERIRKPEGFRLPASGSGRPSGLPIAEALGIAMQIADALDAAHEKGIIHRDLKPANIKITPAGTVKVLDFGLAKAIHPEGAEGGHSNAPTMAADGTGTGVIVGTAAYMSPEQARGQAVDKRTDIWAFGCVLYEMLTGRGAFRGETISDTIAAILEREPDWMQMPADTPPGVLRLLRRCLEKDPRRRLRDIGDVRGDLEPSSLKQEQSGRERTPSLARRWVAAAVLSAVTMAVAAVAWWPVSDRVPPGRPLGPMTRLTWDNGFTTQPAISGDGRLVAYASNRGTDGHLDIWVQQAAGGPPIRLTTDGSDDRDPDVSPDGSLVAFRSDRQAPGVYVVPALSGDARLVAPDGRAPKFSPDGRTIAFWTGSWLAARGIGVVRRIHVVPVVGGSPSEVETDLASVGDPIWSPDGESLMVFGRRATAGDDLQTDWWVVPAGGGAAVRTGSYELLQRRGIDISATNDQPYPAVWSRAGVIFVGRLAGADAASIWSLPVDQGTGRATGEPLTLTAGGDMAASPALSRDGRLVFAATFQAFPLLGVPLDANAGKVIGPIRRLREGGEVTRRAGLSADGRMLVFYSTALGHSDLWLKDLESGRERHLAVTQPAFMNPVISADGRWVAYTVTRIPTGGSAGPGDGYVMATTGGVPRKICDDCEVYSWLDNGSRLFIVTRMPSQILLVDVESGMRTLILSSNRIVDRPVVSPDGRWLSFGEDDGDTLIAPFHPDRPSPQEEWIRVIQSDGAERACGWSPDSKLLYVLLETDGFRCLYAIPIDPVSGRPRGEPLPVHHFHDASLQWGSTGYGNAIAGGMFLANLFEYTGNIWMTTIQR